MTKHFLYILLLFSFISCRTTKESKDNFHLSISEKDALTFNYSFVDAAKQKMLGNSDYAIALYTKCLSINPQSAATLYELARLYFSAGDLNNSIQKLEKACTIAPNNIWYRLYLAEVYMKAGMIDKTESTFSKVIETEPNNIFYRITLAKFLLLNARFNSALSVYDEAERKFGINENISVGKSQIYLNKNDIEKATYEIRKLIKAFPTDIKYLGMLAELYNQFKDSKNALLVYNELLQRDSTNHLVQVSLYNFYQSNNQKDVALPILFKYFKNPSADPQKKVAILFKDFSENNIQDKKTYAYLMQILSSLHPTDDNVLSLHADQLIKDKQYLEAKKLLKSIIAQNASNLRVWQQIVSLDAQLAENIDLKEDTKKALELFPNISFFYLYNGISYYFDRDFKNAIKVFLIGIEYVLDDNESLIQFNTYLGESYQKLGNYIESQKYFDDVLQFNPNDTYVLNNYSYYLSLRGTNLQKAEQMMVKCIELMPNNANYLDTYAYVLFNLNKFKEALQVQTKAITLDNEKNGILLEHFGDIHFKCGNVELGIEYWNKAFHTGKYSNVLIKKIHDKNYIK